MSITCGIISQISIHRIPIGSKTPNMCKHWISISKQYFEIRMKQTRVHCGTEKHTKRIEVWRQTQQQQVLLCVPHAEVVTLWIATHSSLAETGSWFVVAMVPSQSSPLLGGDKTLTGSFSFACLKTNETTLDLWQDRKKSMKWLLMWLAF